MRLRNSLIWILSVLLCTSVILNIHQYGIIKNQRTEFLESNTVMIDSVIQYLHHYDTVFVERWHQSPTKYVYDTIHHENKVYIRDTVQAYEFKEKDYDLAVGAVKLDWYKLDIHTRDTVSYPVHTIVTKPKRWNIGLQAGTGYGLFSRKPDLYVGVGITYRLN